jgi:hypothetical protein
MTIQERIEHVRYACKAMSEATQIDGPLIYMPKVLDELSIDDFVTVTDALNGTVEERAKWYAGRAEVHGIVVHFSSKYGTLVAKPATDPMSVIRATLNATAE